MCVVCVCVCVRARACVSPWFIIAVEAERAGTPMINDACFSRDSDDSERDVNVCVCARARVKKSIHQ